MIVTWNEQTATADQFASQWESCYTTSDVPIRLGMAVQQDSISDTRSVLSFMTPEEDPNPYECARSSGVLAFWDSEKEDVYSLDDGEPA